LSFAARRAEGRSISSDHLTGIPGLAAYDETDLMGYEPNSNTYHWYSITNAGETHDHVATPPNGSAIRFVFNGTQENKNARAPPTAHA
jgi:hypothetical protein